MATTARHDRRSGRVVVHLASDLQVAFRARETQGLGEATPEQLADIEITPSGLGLHFPRLDAAGNAPIAPGAALPQGAVPFGFRGSGVLAAIEARGRSPGAALRQGAVPFGFRGSGVLAAIEARGRSSGAALRQGAVPFGFRGSGVLAAIEARGRS